MEGCFPLSLLVQKKKKAVETLIIGVEMASRSGFEGAGKRWLLVQQSDHHQNGFVAPFQGPNGCARPFLHQQ